MSSLCFNKYNQCLGKDSWARLLTQLLFLLFQKEEGQKQAKMGKNSPLKLKWHWGHWLQWCFWAMLLGYKCNFHLPTLPSHYSFLWMNSVYGKIVIFRNFCSLFPCSFPNSSWVLVHGQGTLIKKSAYFSLVLHHFQLAAIVLVMLRMYQNNNIRGKTSTSSLHNV